ncbi:unnamed protein product [Urochloa humidicola]
MAGRPAPSSSCYAVPHHPVADQHCHRPRRSGPGPGLPCHRLIAPSAIITATGRAAVATALACRTIGRATLVSCVAGGLPQPRPTASCRAALARASRCDAHC